MATAKRTTLSGATARAVTGDWAEMFPELGVWRPLRLLRRVGPLAQGVTLDRSSESDAYTPTCHVHVLADPSPEIAFGLLARLGRVELSRHEREYQDAARELRELSPLPWDDGLTLPLVLDRLREAALAKQDIPNWADGVGELTGMILLAGACGRAELVEQSVELARSLSANWQPDWQQRWGVPAEWPDNLAERAADQRALAAVVDDQVREHGLQDLPTTHMPDR